MGMCCYWFCNYSTYCMNCTTDVENLDSSSDIETPDVKICCPYCGEITKLEFKEEKTYFSMCGYNLFPFDKTDPFLCCKKCETNLHGKSFEKCKCGVSFPKEYAYCPICGKTDNENIDIRLMEREAISKMKEKRKNMYDTSYSSDNMYSRAEKESDKMEKNNNSKESMKEQKNDKMKNKNE